MSTLAEIQADLSTHIGVEVPNNEIVLAYNDFSTLVWRAEADKYPESQRKTSDVMTVPSTGLDLSVITDMRNTRGGFEVFEWGTNQQKLNVMTKYTRAHPALGLPYNFYVEGGVLRIPEIEGTNNNKKVKIIYWKKRTVVSSGADLSTVEFEYDQDLEFAFRKYARMMYFDGRYQPELAQEAEQYAIEQIEGYFSSSLTI